MAAVIGGAARDDYAAEYRRNGSLAPTKLTISYKYAMSLIDL